MGNERGRQKRRDRKRLKREGRRRAARVATEPVPVPGLPAMSLTLERFAEPLLGRLRDRDEAQHWKLVLGFAAMAWNAGADGSDLRDDELRVARRTYAALGWDQAWVEDDARRLFERRAAAPFSKERRMVVGVDVAATATGLRVFAASALV